MHLASHHTKPRTLHCAGQLELYFPPPVLTSYHRRTLLTVYEYGGQAWNVAGMELSQASVDYLTDEGLLCPWGNRGVQLTPEGLECVRSKGRNKAGVQ